MDSWLTFLSKIDKVSSKNRNMGNLSHVYTKQEQLHPLLKNQFLKFPVYVSTGHGGASPKPLCVCVCVCVVGMR